MITIIGGSFSHVKYFMKEVFIVGVDVSKNSFTATVLYDNKKETFEVKSDPVEFEKKIKPYLKKFKKSDMLIIIEHTC